MSNSPSPCKTGLRSTQTSPSGPSATTIRQPSSGMRMATNAFMRWRSARSWSTVKLRMVNLPRGSSLKFPSVLSVLDDAQKPIFTLKSAFLEVQFVQVDDAVIYFLHYQANMLWVVLVQVIGLEKEIASLVLPYFTVA